MKLLRSLKLDPVRDSPKKLGALVEHFKGPNPSIWAVTEGGKELRVSKGLAWKVRDLTLAKMLDWLEGRAPVEVLVRVVNPHSTTQGDSKRWHLQATAIEKVDAESVLRWSTPDGALVGSYKGAWAGGRERETLMAGETYSFHVAIKHAGEPGFHPQSSVVQHRGLLEKALLPNGDYLLYVTIGVASAVYGQAQWFVSDSGMELDGFQILPTADGDDPRV